LFAFYTLAHLIKKSRISALTVLAVAGLFLSEYNGEGRTLIWRRGEKESQQIDREHGAVTVNRTGKSEINHTA